MITLDEIKKNITIVKSQLKHATLIAVSKLQPVELIEFAYQAGQRDFGENYVQELAEKKQKLLHLKDIRWHLIGPLQSNKAKQAIQLADVFHALDSLKLASELSKRVRSESKNNFPVFIEVNLNNEDSKSGLNVSDLNDFCANILQMPELKLLGLMCIPKPTNDIQIQKNNFLKLVQLGGELEKRFSITLKYSMGMSDDYQIADHCGSDYVRVGRKIFGDRPSR